MDELLENLWSAACDVLYHDIPEKTEEYQFNRTLLIEKFRAIIEQGAAAELLPSDVEDDAWVKGAQVP